jgi:peptidoglycan/LPS O-acetylase OafA/YrhL
MTTQVQPPHMQYRPDVDGLRALSILFVVIFHAFPNLIVGGFLGVDIFFVISGFLISTIIFKGLSNHSFQFKEFYARRARRIFPALGMVLFFCYLVGWFSLLGEEFKQLSKHITGGVFFISNIQFWREVGYFDTLAETKPLLHLWSLGIEEQFYIFWPLFLWFAHKRGLNLFRIALGLALASFLLNLWMVQIDPTAAFYSPYTRFWELLSGAVLAWHTMHHPAILVSLQKKCEHHSGSIARFIKSISSESFSNLQSIIGFSLIVVSCFIVRKHFQFPGAWALFPVMGAVLIIAAGPTAWLNRIFLSNKLMVWLGLISFPLYLWHWPLLAFPRIIEGQVPSVMVRLIAVALAILLGWLTYVFVEKRVRFYEEGKIKTRTLIFLMLGVAVLAFVAYKRDGQGFSTEAQRAAYAQFKWKLDHQGPACKEKYLGDQYCNITDINQAPTAAIIGDSHANHFFLGLSEFYRERGGNLLNLGAGACPPFFGIDRARHPVFGDLKCYDRTQPMFDLILKSDSIKTVYIAFHHNTYFDGGVPLIDRWSSINSKDNVEVSTQALLRTIEKIQAHQKQVVLIYDMPGLKHDIKSCFTSRTLLVERGTLCDFDNFMEERAGFVTYDKMIEEVQRRTKMKIFDTRQYMSDHFPVNAQGIPLYRDGTHLSVAGSIFFKDMYRHLYE